jgi:hypothetical protein
MDSRRLIFIHIPKAAGQSVISIISRQYKSRNVAAYTRPVGQLRAEDYDGFSNARAVVGHLHFGVHENLPGQSVYVTCLRNPVSRIVSLFEYMATNPTHHLYEIARQQRIEEFLTSGIAPIEAENGQTRQISGLTQRETTKEMLEVAKRNLTSSFLVPGTAELFDESILLMKKGLGWSLPFYVSRNVSRSRSGRREIEPRVQSVIREYNQLDIELWEFAGELLHRRISTQGRFFNLERVLFRILNKVAGNYRRVRSTGAGAISTQV